MMLTLANYLILSSIIFLLGILGIFLNRHNLVILLMSIELILLSVNLNFIAFSNWIGNNSGQVFVFFILTIAATESAIGLAILILIFRNISVMNIDELSSLNR